MTLVLRQYQQQIVDELRTHWRDRCLVNLPTGGGKTAIMAAVAMGAVSKGKRVLFVAHRRTLVYQTRDRFLQYGLKCGVIMGSDPRSSDPCQVCSIQTLARRDVPADIIICDEAHMATSASWRKVIARYPAVFGCSGTCFRLDGAPLGDIFGRIVSGPSVSDLVSEGILIAPRVFAPPGPDLSGVHRRGGEFVQGELEVAVRKPSLYADIYATWNKRASGMKTVGFAVGIAHSKACAALWGERGRHIDGSTSQVDRDSAVRDLEEGRIDVLWNCDVVSMGWDVPALQCAILARPTASLALHRQQCGRIMRACPSKDGVVLLDHSGNVHRHGLPSDDVEATLTGKAKRAVEKAPRTCPECFAVIDGYPCWDCGHEPEQSVREIERVEGELVEFSADSRREMYAVWIAEASRCGKKIGWAKYRFKEKFGVWPRLKEEDAKYECRGHEYEQRQYGIVCGRCLRAQSAERDPVSSSP